MVDQRVQEFDRAARRAESPDHYGCPVRNIGYCFRDRWTLLIDHLLLLPNNDELQESRRLLPKCLDTIDTIRRIVVKFSCHVRDQ